MDPQESGQEATEFPDSDGNRHVEILDQLTHIQNSRAFCNSARSKEFLFYVVEQALAGHTENLKERSIGVNLFHRAPTYDTGEDPIVRVKAGEVRRRLTEYYAAEVHAPELQIKLPVGSYVPKFRWNIQPVPPPLAPEVEVVKQPLTPPKQFGKWRIAGFAAALALVGIVAAIVIRAYYHPHSALDLFWEPLSATGQPVLICVPSPVSYAFSSDLYEKARSAHTGTYGSSVESNTTPLKLDPETPLKWKDVTPLVDFFVNKDDAYVAAQLSAFFAQLHKSNQVRIGNDFSYEDLRNSPAVLIGVFNNPLVVRMASELPIVFRENGADQWIEEKGNPGRSWHPGTSGRQGSKDFAVVARLLNSKTGQFLVIVGGIGMVGTQAAGRFVSNQGDLEAALRTFPTGWQGKNLEVVLESDVIDGSASPPRVLAVRAW